jgi:hypothetical protein
MYYTLYDNTDQVTYKYTHTHTHTQRERERERNPITPRKTGTHLQQCDSKQHDPFDSHSKSAIKHHKKPKTLNLKDQIKPTTLNLKHPKKT